MKKICIKLIASAVLFFTGLFSLWASPATNTKQYTLENGLTVFILEDDSTPLVRFEYEVRAGFSSQTKNTSGYFKLYTRVLTQTVSDINFDSTECLADSSNYVITTTPSQLARIADRFSTALFAPEFSEEILNTELIELKKEVRASVNDAGSYINAAIDSRVFSAAPWKHDSGVYPSLFARTTSKDARTILDTISQKYYTPQNSAIFLSGNVNTKKALELLNSTFGRYYSSAAIPGSKQSLPVNNQRKFVIHSPDFSEDLTQVVIQYTVLNTEECDTAAYVLNNNYSYFKTSLLNMPELNIPGDEYINASSAHKKNSSRLIVQTLMQPPEDKKNKITSVEQVQKFLDQTVLSATNFSMTEFFAAQQQEIFDLNTINTSSTTFMEKLSAFWAIEPYIPFSENGLENPENSIIVSSLLDRTNRLSQIDYKTMQEKLNYEAPFVFVIINSSDFKKNKKAYTAAGFEEINQKNAPWYSQSIYAKIIDPEEDKEPVVPYETISRENNFVQENKNSIKTFTLENGIPLVTKKNENSTGITILLSIKGGKLNSAQNNGFEDVMINLLAGNIQQEIFRQQYAGMVLGNPSVDWETGLTTSTITIECEAADLTNVCKSISNALIYSDVIPSYADRAVANRQYKKRLENGSAVRQLYCAAVNKFYPKSDLSKIFEAQNEILEKTSYKEILSKYPEFLDASRYSIIVTGNFIDDLDAIMNSTLGMLGTFRTSVNVQQKEIETLINNKLTVKVVHTFLTDIPKEKAGPMPAVLIPTTEFLDPVIYCFKTPEKGTKEQALFNALLYYTALQLQNNIDHNSRLKGAKVSVQTAEAAMSFGSIIIQNVPHTKELDAEFKNTLELLVSDLQGITAVSTAQAIKDIWTKNEMTETVSNTGTAKLIQKGFEQLFYSQNQKEQAEYYLCQYDYIQNASVQELLNTAISIPETPELRVYSADAKK